MTTLQARSTPRIATPATPATLAAAATEAALLNAQEIENIDDILLDEVDIGDFEAAAARTPLLYDSAASATNVQSSANLANRTLPAATHVSSANSSANSQPQAQRKRGRPKGSKDKAPRMTKARKLAMQQGNDGQM